MGAVMRLTGGVAYGKIFLQVLMMSASRSPGQDCERGLGLAAREPVCRAPVTGKEVGPISESMRPTLGGVGA